MTTKEAKSTSEKAAAVVREILMNLVKEGYDFGPLKHYEYQATARIYSPEGTLYEVSVFEISPSGSDA